MMEHENSGEYELEDEGDEMMGEEDGEIVEGDEENMANKISTPLILF